MDLDLLDRETKIYTQLLADLDEQMGSGRQIDFVPFELFRLHTEVCDRATDLMAAHILELQESVKQLQEVAEGTIDKLAEAVSVLNVNTKRLEQAPVPEWAGHGPS